jgi:alkylhydroperoxidase family enzyme
MEKKIISYSLEHLQDSKFQLEILTNDGVTLFQGDITDCQKHINYFIYDNPNAKFGSEPNEVLNLNNMQHKQTAVDWLEQAYWDNKGTLSQKHFEQAKQMEKEQMIEAYYEGKEYGFKEQGEQYYNETFGGNNE